MNNKLIIDEIVCTCARELFAQYDTPLEHTDGALDPHDYAAVIGFYGQAMRGAVGIGLDRATVARIHHRHAEDWIGEVANQLLGRMKNKLVAYGVTLGSALPMVLRGLEVHLVKSTTEIWPYRFRCSGGGGVTIWFDAYIDAELVLALCPYEDPPISREGEITLF